jgi:hypothetical protein
MVVACQKTQLLLPNWLPRLMIKRSPLPVSNFMTTTIFPSHQLDGPVRTEVMSITKLAQQAAAVEVAWLNLKDMERRDHAASCPTVFVEAVPESAPTSISEEDYQRYLLEAVASQGDGLEHPSVDPLLARLKLALVRAWKSRVKYLLKSLLFLENNRWLEARGEQHSIFALLPPVNAPSLSQV